MKAIILAIMAAATNGAPLAATEQNCATCANATYIRCPPCRGGGLATCSTCNGGKFGPDSITTTECDRCYGKGMVQEAATEFVKGGPGRKSFTRKTGKMVRVACKDCNGKGSITKTEAGYCPACHGTGHQNCEGCGGWGRVWCPTCQSGKSKPAPKTR